MYAFQCSKCENLHDLDERCHCGAGVDPRPNHREKGSAELCRKNFKRLDDKKVWHARFTWETK